MPPNTVSVTRPGKWGNPYVVGGSKNIFAPVPDDAAMAVRWFRDTASKLPAEAFAPLRGKNLACWCALDAPCHADVLLEIANA